MFKFSDIYNIGRWPITGAVSGCHVKSISPKVNIARYEGLLSYRYPASNFLVVSVFTAYYGT